ncbi:uncharacterized protein LOC122071032 [Macadamia integrifolia]|uniref:uncharacterized protein LOC122071032 n=1 Tax=Macadamia integrifolia TaxID=60698 RepID=UPI001C4F064F|nr:uncharacterized protein LOC122071032 [Macadamia integrifolia]
MACGCGGECPLSSSTSPFHTQSPPTNRRGGHSVAFSSLAFQKKMKSGRAGFRRKNSSHPTTLLELSEPTTKKANLSARRKKSIKLPNYVDDHGRIYPISEFLSHPSGVEAILNTRALQSFESLDSKTYRCSLPKIQLLKFEVAPVLDLRVTATGEDCIVEMLSCKVTLSSFHFSYYCILLLCAQINTRPFTLLPISAVENPGNLIMQTLVDKLVPMLLEQLVEDYEKWVQEQCEISP